MQNLQGWNANSALITPGLKPHGKIGAIGPLPAHEPAGDAAYLKTALKD